MNTPDTAKAVGTVDDAINIAMHYTHVGNESDTKKLTEHIDNLKWLKNMILDIEG